MSQYQPMSGLDDIRYRIAATYNGYQIGRTILAMAIVGCSAMLFPDDFSFVTQNRVFLSVLGSLLILWMTLFTFFVRRRLSVATTVERISDLLRVETAWYSVSLTLFALSIPISATYYVNMGWVMTGILITFVLTNPFISSGLARCTIASPILGWTAHTAIHWLAAGRGPHWPALFFCLAMVALFYYSRKYFIQHLTRRAVESSDAQPDAVSLGYAGTERAFSERYGLSPREAEVLGRILRGRVTKEISVDLGISETTIKTHVRNIFGKVEVRSRLELFATFNRYAQFDSTNRNIKNGE